MNTSEVVPFLDAVRTGAIKAYRTIRTISDGSIEGIYDFPEQRVQIHAHFKDESMNELADSPTPDSRTDPDAIRLQDYKKDDRGRNVVLARVSNYDFAMMDYFASEGS